MIRPASPAGAFGSRVTRIEDTADAPGRLAARCLFQQSFFRGPDAEPVASEIVLPPGDLPAAVQRAAQASLTSEAVLFGNGLEMYAEQLHGVGRFLSGVRTTPAAGGVGRLTFLADNPP